MKTITPVSKIAGEISLPGDKSISHRAAFLGALSTEGIEVSNFSPGADCASTLRCLEKIGCSVTRTGGVVRVRKVGSFMDPDSVLDAGNSGTTARLLCGLVSGQPGLFAVISGDESLSRRPMGRVVRPLQAMGARIDGRKCGEGLPLAVKGTLLTGGRYTPSAASAQIKTSLILAGLSSSGSTTVNEPRQTRDHTEIMLSYLKVPVLTEGLSVTVFPSPDLPGGSWVIPGDFSASAFWLVAGSILPGSELVIKASGINPTRTGLMKVLERMGASIRLVDPGTSGGEPVADINVKAAPLRGVEIGEEE
ncbi:MAG: 3-phosphoshikimate 1-carboxyvinyltransferase, partial [Synergistales bacterium]|nr:3-phosphoshikimate 1-carboxyvinyltransferase [Synergistales bacterium]